MTDGKVPAGTVGRNVETGKEFVFGKDGKATEVPKGTMAAKTASKGGDAGNK